MLLHRRTDVHQPAQHNYNNRNNNNNERHGGVDGHSHHTECVVIVFDCVLAYLTPRACAIVGTTTTTQTTSTTTTTAAPTSTPAPGPPQLPGFILAGLSFARGEGVGDFGSIADGKETTFILVTETVGSVPAACLSEADALRRIQISITGPSGEIVGWRYAQPCAGGVYSIAWLPCKAGW